MVAKLGGSPTNGTFNTILNHIPGIIIREFQQDTKFDTIVSLFKNLVDGYSSGKEQADSDQNQDSFIDKASYKAGYAF